LKLTEEQQDTFVPQVIPGDYNLHCFDNFGLNIRSRVGSISFTAGTFNHLFLQEPLADKFALVQNVTTREWLNNFFYEGKKCTLK